MPHADAHAAAVDMVTAALLQASDLPRAWADQPSWTILDTAFDNGARLLACWLAWRSDAQRPRMLHYVGHTDTASYLRNFGPAPAVPGEAATSDALRGVLRATLHAACQDRGPGIHRILLDAAQVSLTLCIGDASTLWAQHRLFAHTIWFDPPVPAWDKWAAKALARICLRGARLSASLPPHAQVQWLQEAGFVDCRPAANPTQRWSAVFQPAWSLGRKEPPQLPLPARRCCIVGAGISGASLAYALARRGWQVQVLEQAPDVAAGASGLPAGLVVPHVSADDSPRSRLSRVGARLMLQHTAHLLRSGHDWQASGVLEHRAASASPQWHTHAGWLRPAALVRAWLNQPGIAVHTHCKVEHIERSGSHWQVFDSHGHCCAQAEVLVFANALAVRKLLAQPTLHAFQAHTLARTLEDLHAVHGTASCGPMPADTAGPDWMHPHNGHGCFIPHLPDGAAGQWLAGSSFEPEECPPIEHAHQHHMAPLPTQHQHNLARLQKLVPTAATALSPQFANHSVHAWSGTRCVTHDRLPLAGPVDTHEAHGLWMQVGMGARGLTFSALCAEWIAARLCHEPWPVEHSLARCIDSQRLRKRRTLRDPANDS